MLLQIEDRANFVAKERTRSEKKREKISHERIKDKKKIIYKHSHPENILDSNGERRYKYSCKCKDIVCSSEYIFVFR